IERVPDLQAHVRDAVSRDAAYAARVADASSRANVYRAHVERLRQTAPPPAARFNDVIDEAARFVDEMEKTRPPRDGHLPDVDRRQNPRHPKGGRTGREEWT